MLRIILSVIIVAICIFLFIFTYLLNKKTKKPDGCTLNHCDGCQIMSCPSRKKEDE